MVADHIIIGSGINALTAAAMLSGKGHKVLVLERADHVGGCMLSTEATLPGFTHDVMAATFVLFLTGPAHAALGQDLARHGLEFCHTPHPTGVIRPDGSGAVLTTDRAQNAADFDRLSPGDGAAYKADVTGIEANAPLLFGLLGGEVWSRQTATLIAREAWKRGPRALLAYLGEALMPARRWLGSTYRAPELQALFAPWTLHCGLSPDDTYSGQMGKIVAFALEAAGAPIVKGGAGKAALAFSGLIEERGGTVRTDADVERILVENGRAVGVRLAGGEEIRATRSVIASVAPAKLYGKLLGNDAPQSARETVGSYTHGRGNFQLNYALDAAPRWTTDGFDKVALVHLTDGIDAVSKSHNEALRGMLPETPTICVGQPAALDPSRAPEGKAILWVQIPDAPRTIKGDAAGEIATDGTWNEATREAFADRIEAILKNHISNFDEIVLKRRAYSPADLEAININLVGGDPYGGAATIDQFFVWRPLPGSVNHATGIKDLHHIGASTHPGPGLSGGSGFLVANRIAR